MQRQRETVCQLDCFCCPYPDCVLDEPMTVAEYAEAAQRERMIKDANRSQSELRVAAKKAAYRDAHREEIAAYQAAYRDAHKSNFAVYGARVRELRKALRLSQTELGLEFGLSRQQISRYERGEVPFDRETVIGWLLAESRKGV